MADANLRLPALPQSWRQHRIISENVSAASTELFRTALNDAVDERPMQTYLASHPHLLTCLLPPGTDVWCWDRPRLGSESIPDFLLCTRNSTGIEWVMVELESPTVSPLIQSGLPGAKLREAQGQIQDWRIWLRDNVTYAQGQLGFIGLTAEASATIVIGRRSAIDTKQAKKWREITTQNTRIMTYDRLIDSLSIGRTNLGGSNE